MIALILATALLVIIPGPNVALIVARSLQSGFCAGFITTLGTTCGVGLQLMLVVVGISVAIEYAAATLSIFKWIGALYLIGLGIYRWRTPATVIPKTALPPTPLYFGQGMLLALLNPKTLLFNAAFLPQFAQVDASGQASLLQLALVYLAVLLLGDLLWARFASLAKAGLGQHAQLLNRLSGGLFVGAGVGLALSRRFD